MTKILLASLVAGMLALTGLVAYNSFSGSAAVSDQVAATDDDACSGCCSKESTGCCSKESAAATDACPGCPLGEKGGCCKEAVKSPCCGGDAAVKPGAGAKAEAKKE